MDLLPSSHTEFSQPDYWDRFFKKRGKIPFEWYGEYPNLCTVLHKYITPANQVLVVGCGNSALSQDMYDNGLQNLVNIDISDVVIRQMTDRHKEKRPKMTFEKMDVTQMTYSDGHFHVALDKGTLDALMVSEDPEVVANVQRMFAEVSRCLRLTGRYIIISLLQHHVQKVLLDYFTALGWPVRIHRIATGGEEEGESGSLSMPVFAVVVTKLKAMPNMPQIVEVCRFDDRIDRLEDVCYLTDIVKDMQYYHIVRQQLRKRLSSDQQLSLELHSRELSTPRYTLTVVDAPHNMENKFAIFIVPQGRETEWLFSTDKGRLNLQASAGFQRLVVVTLSRGHHYDNLEAIKAELSGKVMELAPPGCRSSAQVPFLSIGEDLGQRRQVALGESEASGHYLVEDVELNGGQVFRRLVFLNNKMVVQSEARMVPGRKKKKRRQGSEAIPQSLHVDKSHLPCAYQPAMVAGLACLPSLEEDSITGVLVGLGGGGVPSFLHSILPQLTLDVVELDPAVVDVATKWFEFKPDERLKVHVADGISFIRDLVASGQHRDVVLIDVDSKDASVGVNCPPLSFVEPEFLAAISQLLSPYGVLILNLASRDESMGHSILERIISTFSSCAFVKLEEDVNTIVFAGPSLPSMPEVRARAERLDTLVSSVWKDCEVTLAEVLEGLKSASE